MTEKRFECDSPLDYRGYGVFDLSKVDMTKDDFRDEDGICLYEFHNYLVDETDAMMTGGEVVDKLNEQEETIQDLKTRNKRQYDLLKKITDLMYARDWKSLEQIVNNWEEEDRLVQAESRHWNGSDVE